MRELVVIEERPFRVGYDELVRLFAIADGEGIIFIIFDQADDLEFQLLAVGRLDDEDVAQFEEAVVFRSVFDLIVMAVPVR